MERGGTLPKSAKREEGGNVGESRTGLITSSHSYPPPPWIPSGVAPRFNPHQEALPLPAVVGTQPNGQAQPPDTREEEGQARTRNSRTR